jgi:APA family basic amino acid/polyamine antiporter
MVVGGTIGVGIFLTPAEMARSTGSPGLLLLVWTFLALMALAGALVISDTDAPAIMVALRHRDRSQK